MSLPLDFLHDLKRRLHGEVRLDRASRLLYSTDASIYQIEPLGVVLPRDQDDLHATVELAAEYRIPILPRGSGSSLAGQAIGPALILDCSRWLDSIVEIDPQARTATVEPGVILADLNRQVARYGLMFGPDPASAERATLGGVIGNNATGAHSIRYGMTVDHLLEADVILSDGTLAHWGPLTPADLERALENGSLRTVQQRILHAVQTIRHDYGEDIRRDFPRTWRNSAGYRLNYLLPWSPSAPPQWIDSTYPPAWLPDTVNLASLLAGSEGTLAVIRRATLRLVPRPKHSVLGVLAYPEIVAACEDVPRLLTFQPSAIELIPQVILRLARSVPAYARQMTWLSDDPAAVLVVEFDGDRPEVLEERLRQVGTVMYLAATPADQARVWNVRKVGLGILDSRPQPARPVSIIEDGAVPVERLGEFVRQIERILAEHRVEGGIHAHASAGCLHIRPVLDLRTRPGVQALRSIAEQTMELTLGLGGSISSEHGDGIARGEFLARLYGPRVSQAMRFLKQAADPHGLLNPGKMFDAPPLDTHLRYRPGEASQIWTPTLDFQPQGGLQLAIEQCNGQGVCRKMSGVMCPSFQATREEANSTRGRANLLRALIASPQAAYPVWTQPDSTELVQATFKALDLCLGCKGCQAECPSGVDMAKLKVEFMHRYYRQHSRPWRDYLFGYFPVTAALLSLLAPGVNFLSRQPAVQHLVTRQLGLAPERPLPRFTWRRARPRWVPAAQETVLFLSDPFSRYIEPQVEQAAFDLLAACGCGVIRLPLVGAGVSLFSKSFLEAARRHARRLLAAIQGLDPQGRMAIVGVEPSEVYFLKRDYIALLPECAAEIAALAERVWLLEEFLLREGRLDKLRVAERFDASWARGKTIVRFQPHCHQRAEPPAADGLPVGPAATLSLLRSLGIAIQLLDAACCGMAGSFGYEAEHHPIAVTLGRRLLESAALAPGEPLLCSGAACRLHLRWLTSSEVRHPVEVLAEYTAGP